MKHLSILVMLLCVIVKIEAHSLPLDTITYKTTTITKIDSATKDTITSEIVTIKLADKTSCDSESYMIDENNQRVNFFWERKKERLQPHWSGIGMSFMNYDDSKIPHGAPKASTSHNFTFNLMSYGKQLGHSNFMLVTGVGTEWSRYHFDNNAGLTKVDGVAAFVPAPEGVNYRSSKMLAYYITIPLMLEYQISKIHVSAGAVCFFKWYSKSQVKFYDEAGKHKDNLGKDLNMRPIDLRLKGQIGLDNVSIFGYYAPSSMFKKDKGPDLKTYAIGVMLHFN